LRTNLDSDINKLDSVDSNALRETLAETTDPKAVKRLMIALAYDDGVSVDIISERYGIARSTVYSWLDRLEEQSIADAIYDEHRPGRPPLLDEHERKHLTEVLHQPPGDVGFEQRFWTPELAQEYIQREYEVSYSLGYVRQLLHD
jgi:transposase